MPVSEEARKDFNESIRPIKEQINGLIKKIRMNPLRFAIRRKGWNSRKLPLLNR